MRIGFQLSVSGVYLPLLWESAFCSRDPLILGYTRGHFTALIPVEPPHDLASPSTTSSVPFEDVPPTDAPSPMENETKAGASNEGCDLQPPDIPSSASAVDSRILLPLFNRHGAQLPVRFAPKNVAVSLRSSSFK